MATLFGLDIAKIVSDASAAAGGGWRLLAAFWMVCWFVRRQASVILPN